jgi:hypothetical protein
MAEPAHAIVEYVLYGSASGEGGYDILGHSDQVSPEEQEVVARFSNVGGSVLLEDGPEAIYTFYPLAPASERWAFTQIAFLKKGPRGNVYRALTLVLDAETLDDLRWEPFLLGGVFRAVEERKAAIPLSRTKLEAASRRTLSLGTGIDLNQLAAVLRRLAEGAVAFACAGRGEGVAVCRAVLAALPPDDRRGLSFCTRYSYRQSLELRLAFYAPADEEEIGRYLEYAGISARGPWGSLPAQRDSFWSWCEALPEGLDPLSGLTLLHGPLEAIRLSHFFRRWIQEGAEPPGMTPEVRQQIFSLILDERNRTLESVGNLRVSSAWRELRDRLAAALAAEPPFAVELATVSRWIATVTAKDSSLEELRTFALGRAAAARADLLDRTACVLLLVLGAHPQPDLLFGADPRPDPLLGPPGSQTAFQSPGEVACWIEELAADHSQACLELLTLCLRRWRTLASTGCVTAAQAIAQGLASRATSSTMAATALFLTAFEQSAPEDPEEKASWLLDLLRRVGPAAGPVFNPLRASRIVAQEELIGRLTEAELTALAEPLAERFPGPLARQLDWDGVLAGPGLLALLARCKEGLLLGDSAAWDVARSPDHWDLASRVALRSAQVASAAGGAGLWSRLAWLLWNAAHFDAAGRAPAEGAAGRRFTAALGIGFEQCPPGVMHVLVDTAFRQRKAGRHAGRERLCPEPLRMWLAALRDIRDHCPAGTRFYSLTVLSHLVRDGFFAS